MMEFFLQQEDDNEEEEYGKCRKHPSSTITGVCPICLTNRLILLCPDCAHPRPCSCLRPSADVPTSSSSSSTSSSSSSFSFSFSYAHFSKSKTNVGAIGRVSFLIDTETALRRSSSAAFHLTRAKSAVTRPPPPPPETWIRSSSSSSFWSFLKAVKTKKRTEEEGKSSTKEPMPRTRSVGISRYSDPKDNTGRDVRLKLWGWRFLSPIKIFRRSKTVRVVHESSPLCRG